MFQKTRRAKVSSTGTMFVYSEVVKKRIPGEDRVFIRATGDLFFEVFIFSLQLINSLSKFSIISFHDFSLGVEGSLFGLADKVYLSEPSSYSQKRGYYCIFNRFVWGYCCGELVDDYKNYGNE